ncbi:MAG: hypothetical protein M3203_01350 [Actinomycetota bacterium]|nr:hypothetical protein [Actinomycetota bacterium]
MTLLLLFLAAVWAAFLIPPWLRSRSERRPGDSVVSFNRQLSVLRRTAPRTGRVPGGDHWYHQRAATPLVPSHRPVRSNRTSAMAPAHRAPRPVRPGPAASSAARSRTMRRRRDVLSALVVAVLATLVLGLLPAFRFMLLFHVVADLLLVAYVALLIHQRNVAAERELKVRFLPNHRLEPAMLRAEPALLRRSAN